MTEAINRALADGAVERPARRAFLMSEISTSSCPTRAELQDLIAGRLSEQRHALLEKHVNGCAPCQDTLSSLDEQPSEFCSLVHEILAFAPESYSAADVDLRHRSARGDACAFRASAAG